jgi:predicted MFS family arabinose efflux permease
MRERGRLPLSVTRKSFWPGHRQRLDVDARRIVAAQAARALAYGLGSVLIGVTLGHSGLSVVQVGLVLTALLAGSALASLAIARNADRIGRRRCYRVLFLAMAAAGTVFALASSLPALLLAALTGTVSTDVIESGPFTSLEQAMLPNVAADGETTRLFGVYNTVATLAGSLGALLALAGSSRLLLLAYPIAAAAGLAASARLTPSVELAEQHETRQPLHRSRRTVRRLSALFAVDSFAGGFVPQTFIAYLFTRKYGASPDTLAILFFTIGLLQAVSFQLAVRLAARIGLLRTMVFTHLPSNVLLAAVAFAPNLATAIALLLGRSFLSQMDVPTRQAYVVALVDPSERTAAAAYTNTARNLSRPLAPVLAGVALRAGLGLPFVLAGTLKSAYDLAFYASFRGRPVCPAIADRTEGGPSGRILPS